MIPLPVRIPHFLAQAAVFLSGVSLSMVDSRAVEPVVFQPAYAACPVDNPLKGFVPYAGQGRDFPHSLEFNYLSLASMMTGPSDFNWAPMEHLLDDIASRGCQSVFRIYMEYPNKPSGVPEYLVKAGVKIRKWTNTNTQPFPPAVDHTPDYEDPRLREALKNFIAALGSRYDGDPRIGFITAGLLGTWGEWHCYPHTEWFASKTVQAEVMDAYEIAFKKTPVLLRYPAGENDYAHAANGHRKFGYHDDSFAWATLDTGRKDEEWFYLTALRNAGPAAMKRWITAPIGGEIRPELWPCLWKKEGCKEGQDLARCVRETHATWLMESSTSSPLAPDERERALAAARSLGYELQVVKATAALEARALEVAVTIKNLGVAPFYAGWPVRVLAVDSSGVESGGEMPFVLKSLLPAASDTQAVKLDLGKLAAGEIKLFVSISNPLKGGKPFRFANADQDRDRVGWVSLGQVEMP